MKNVAIIPARFASSRLPGKVLKIIGDKPMIQHVYERVLKSQAIAEVYIACDDDRILKVCQSFGAECFKSKKEHISGTDRIAEAAQSIEADVIVNVQGDEPFIAPESIDLICSLFDKPNCEIATLSCSLKEEESSNPNVVKAIVENNIALDFSRIFDAKLAKQSEKHLGIYAFKKSVLLELVKLPPSKRELKERLEQLRWLNAGKTIHIKHSQHQNISVDTAEDLAIAIKQYKLNNV